MTSSTTKPGSNSRCWWSDNVDFAYFGNVHRWVNESVLLGGTWIRLCDRNNVLLTEPGFIGLKSIRYEHPFRIEFYGTQFVATADGVVEKAQLLWPDHTPIPHIPAFNVNIANAQVSSGISITLDFIQFEMGA